jgi:hypothetical protein
MPFQYDKPTSRADVFSTLFNEFDLRETTRLAIEHVLGLPGARTVNVGHYDGTTYQAPPDVAVDMVVVDLAGEAGDERSVWLPAPALNNANVFLFESEADLSMVFTSFEGVLASSQGNDKITVLGDKDVFVDGGDGNDVIITSGGNDIVIGGFGADTITTGAGDDVIVSGEGMDVIDGGEGYDVILVSNEQSFDWVAIEGGALKVVDENDEANSIEFKNIEFIQIGEGALSEDGGSVSIVTSEAAAAALRLYEGLLDRQADLAGDQFWRAKAMEEGVSTATIARAFMDSAEFKEANPTLTDVDFLDMLYSNALDREADAGGYAFWLSKLSVGADRAVIAADFINGNEGVENISTVVLVEEWV